MTVRAGLISESVSHVLHMILDVTAKSGGGTHARARARACALAIKCRHNECGQSFRAEIRRSFITTTLLGKQAFFAL